MECGKDREHYEPLYFHPRLSLLDWPAKNNVLGLALTPPQRCQTFPLLFAHTSVGHERGQGSQGSPCNLKFDILLLNF